MSRTAFVRSRRSCSRRRRARIVNTASVAGPCHGRVQPKHAVVSLTETLYHDLQLA
ncbi:MAG: Short-chain dehydrogenase/reductase SDR [uncultured Paraburkholderia sp.]|nr:MAG: Short-chain dehydrogenase/reductase SDR [uncultured Paraburkholderia sp.]CAH2930951.1 MAG: Short-chain dehydrogenase/reductase SDR [uncultured Paraburkholderia sp.]